MINVNIWVHIYTLTCIWWKHKMTVFPFSFFLVVSENIEISAKKNVLLSQTAILNSWCMQKSRGTQVTTKLRSSQFYFQFQKRLTRGSHKQYCLPGYYLYFLVKAVFIFPYGPLLTRGSQSLHHSPDNHQYFCSYY